MSNTEPTTTTVADTIAAGQAVAPQVTPQQPGESRGDFEARYNAEVADRIKERNLYKPATRLLADLTPDQQAAIMDLAERVRNGDTEGILDWNEQTIASVGGGTSAADVIAARQQARRAAEGAATAAANGDQPAPTAGMTAEQVQALVEQGIAARDLRTQVQATLAAANFPMGSAAGDVILRHCYLNREAGMTPEQGIEWYRGELAKHTGASTAAATTVAAATVLPATAPTGAAPAGAPAAHLKPAEKALLRLQGHPVT